MNKESYNSRVRPDFKVNKDAVEVDVDLFIRSISNLNEINMEYLSQITLRQKWVDERLAYGNNKSILNPPEYFILNDDSKIWMVDTFFPNEKSAHRHMIDKPNMLLRVYGNGSIIYSVRLSLVLSCPMYLQYYPMDVQNCYIDLASYGYTKEDIEYKWNDEAPIQFRKGLTKSLPQFEIINYTTTTCESVTKLGNFSCLRFKFSLKRQIGYYLLHLFIPSILLVMVSWISFYLDPNAVPGRVTLGTVTLLTLIANANGINSKLPPVSYIKAIDIWILFCVVFLFTALVEFAITCFLYNRKPTYTLVDKTERNHSNIEDREGNSYNCRMKFFDRFSGNNAKQIECMSRMVFPICFLLFNVFFWTYYSEQRYNY
uniref:Ig-like domain-containing protein n=1 Tax=Strongyloides papillosus TaxID=174720 RepID=A0A0N5BAJ1_STREA